MTRAQAARASEPCIATQVPSLQSPWQLDSETPPPAQLNGHGLVTVRTAGAAASPGCPAGPGPAHRAGSMTRAAREPHSATLALLITHNPCRLYYHGTSSSTCGNRIHQRHPSDGPSLACQLVINKKNPGDSEAMVRVYRNSNGPGHLPRRTAVSGTMAEGSCAAGFHVTVNFRLGVDLS